MAFGQTVIGRGNSPLIESCCCLSVLLNVLLDIRKVTTPPPIQRHDHPVN